MSSKINAISTGVGGLATSADASGILEIQTNDTTAITVDGSQNVGIGTSSPNTKLHLYGATVTALVERTGADSAGYRAKTTLGDFTWGVGIATAANCWNVYDGTAATERMRIDASGTLFLGQTSNPASGSMVIKVPTGLGNGINFQANATGTSYANGFYNNTGGLAGFISFSGTTTSYTTSSDYRLKHDIQPMTGALDKVVQLKPVTYKWNADNSNSQGFIAHELQEIVPDCVSGEKDAVDAEGNPKYQGIDTSFLVATLTAAIQEQQAIIESLTARIEALEGVA